MALPTIDQLKRALHLQETIAKLQDELSSILGRAGAKVLGVATSGMEAMARGIKAIKVPRKKGKMSAAGRAAIVAAQKKRWAAVKAKGHGTGNPKKPAKKKSKMSAAGRAAIVKAQKARWKKIKAEKKA